MMDIFDFTKHALWRTMLPAWQTIKHHLYLTRLPQGSITT
jgi:hypothetical protein